MISIEFAFQQANTNKEEWFFDGGFYDQPAWHIKLVREAKKIILELREKAKK